MACFSEGRFSAARSPARAFLWAFNKKGDFDNLEDTVDGLHGILDASFRDVEIEVAGSAAMFSATAPRA
jgi:hypothetical protein